MKQATGSVRSATGARGGIQPLLVHFVFHPHSTAARALAEELHDELNSDPVTPGLRVPTTFCPVLDDLPAAALDLGQAERSFVVVLADDKLNLDPSWCRYVGDTWLQCDRSGRHRCVPVQLARDAWPLDNRLEGVNFAPAFDPATTHQTATRTVVIELCRFLSGLGRARRSNASNAPTTIFLSHAKIDLTKEPMVVKRLIESLTPNQQNKTWFDSGDIDAGSQFEAKIKAGLRDSSLLCVLTDSYGSREWCRREVLLAKQAQRPIVVIDALTSHESRSFPYMGNVPVLRWDGNAQRPIDHLLKETLRVLHVELLLDQDARPGDVKFTRPPELITVAAMPSGKRKRILYPDPPWGWKRPALWSPSGWSQPPQSVEWLSWQT